MMPSKNSIADNGDIGNNFDLRRNYQTAVDCLIQCESIIATLQDQLASKDEVIGTLEDKIVHMSLELASSKAFEDAHRSTKREMSIVEPKEQDDIDDLISDDEDYDESSPPQDQHQQSRWPSSRSDNNKKKKQQQQQQQQNRELRSTWSLSLGSTNLDSVPSTAPSTLNESSKSSDIITRSVVGTTSRRSNAVWPTLDESSSSRLSTFDFGQFFRKKEDDVVVVAANDDEKQGQEMMEHEQDDPTDATNIRARRPPNKRRLERLQSSLQLSGVVFPKSFDDVVSKGLCLELGNSLKCMASEQEKLRLELECK